MNRFRIFLAFVLLLSAITGCGGDPELHSISGKVTLDGKPYERLIVYFRPIAKDANQFNLGVGETDAEGNLALRSSAGDGLAAGKYKVTFTCLVVGRDEESVGMSDEKMDDNPTMIPVELVPEKFTDYGDSPIEFEIKRGTENFFEFDIPGE